MFIYWIIAVVFIMLILFVMLYRRQHSNYLYSVNLSQEDMVQSIRDLAQDLREVDKVGGVPKIKPYLKKIKKARILIQKKLADGGRINDYEKDLYENYNWIKLNIKAGDFRYFSMLPHKKNQARVLLLARLICSGTKYKLSLESVSDCIKQFNKFTTLKASEIIAMKDAIAIAIIEKMASVSDWCIKDFKMANYAKWDEQPNQKFCDDESYIYHYKHSGKNVKSNFFYRRSQLNPESIDMIYGNRLIDNSILISNCINSVKQSGEFLTTQTLLESSNINQAMLIDEIYANMDISSKLDYFFAIEKLAKLFKVNETAIVKSCFELAKEHNIHFGEILFDYRYAIKLHLHNLSPQVLKRPTTKFDQRFFSICVWLLDFAFVALSVIFAPYLWLKILVGACVLIAAYLPSQYIIRSAFSMLIPNRATHKMNFKSVDDNAKTLVVVSYYITSTTQAKQCLDNMINLKISQQGNNIKFCMLIDLKKHDKQTCVDDQNIYEFFDSQTCDDISILIRSRTKLKNGYGGFERKRGAIDTLNQSLINDEFVNFSYIKNKPEKPKFVMLLDDDTQLEIGGVLNAVNTMIHPQNKHYDLMTLDCKTRLSSITNRFAKIKSRTCGVDSYCNYSDFYYNLSSKSIFCGKGMYRLENFYNKLSGKIPIGRVLSHDIIEGAILDSGSLNVACYEDSPSNFSSYVSRANRWFRGDLLLGKFLCSKYVSSPIYRHIILANIIGGMATVANLVLLLTLLVTQNLMLLIPIAVCFVLQPLLSIILAMAEQSGKIKYRYNFLSVWHVVSDAVSQLFLLPFWAVNNTWIMLKTVFCLIFAKDKLLEWNTFYHEQSADSFRRFIYLSISSIVIITAIAAAFYTNIVLVVYAALSIIALLISFFEQKLPLEKSVKLDSKQQEYLTQKAKKICDYFDDMLQQNILICDNIQIYPASVDSGKITSPTNIGFSILSQICKFELNLCNLEQTQIQLKAIIEMVSKLKKWNGHLYNWYELSSGEPTDNKFISSVDSGNFVACLYCALSFCERHKLKWLTMEISQLILQTNFEKLYSQQKDLYYLGYNVDNDSYVGAYDMLASEARLMTYIACCQKNDMTAWKKLNRTHTNLEGNLLVSWSGTAFEYLLPQIFLPDVNSSLITTTINRFCKFMQRQKCNGLWGISESGYYRFDSNLNYQYYAFGLAGVSLKSQMNRCVISPYSSMLALKYNPKQAIKNLKNIEKDGGGGKYGFYEAIDFTFGKQIVFSYMSHHQGMALAGIVNTIKNNCLNELFFENPIIKSGKLALEEKPVTTITKALIKQDFVYNKVEGFDLEESKKVNFANPQVIALKGNCASCVLDSFGNSFTKFDDMYINDYKPDCYENYGAFIYIKSDEQVFSPTFAPLRDRSDEYQVVNSLYDCVFKNISKACQMQVFMPNNMNCEVRKISINNNSNKIKSYKIAYVQQLTLASWEEYHSHPAYNDLFMNISYDKQTNSLIAHRKQRSQHGDVFCGLNINGLDQITPVCNLQNFVGRTRNFCDPVVFEKSHFDLANLGDVINPCFGFIAEVVVQPKSNFEFCLSTTIAEDRQSLLGLLMQINQNDFSNYALASAKLSMLSQAKKYIIDEQTYECFKKLSALILFKNYAKTQLIKMFKSQKPLPMGLDKNKKFVFYHYDGDDNILKIITRSCVYCNLVGINFDLVIAYDEDDEYNQITKQKLLDVTGISDLYSLPFMKFFVKTKSNVDNLERIKAFAFLNAKAAVLDDLDFGQCSFEISNKNIRYDNIKPHLQMLCGAGGFDKYNNYCVTSTPDLVYSNVVCLKEGGFVVTENGGGFVYNKNSYSDKLTVWDNQVVFDKPSENICIDFGGKIVRLNKLNTGGYVSHRVGESVYFTSVNNIEFALTQTLNFDGLAKVWHLSIKNTTNSKVKLNGLFHIVPCLNNVWNKGCIFDQTISKDVIRIANAMSGKDMYLSSDIPLNLVHDRACIQDLSQCYISGIGIGKSNFYNPAHAATFELNLNANAQKIITFCLSSDYEISNQVGKESWNLALAKTRDYFNNMSPIKIDSGNKQLDILFNDWLFYQVESSRINGKCGYYQVGGAIGFRDQLQDCLAILYKNPAFVREHILISAEHQYLEGDVMHWWHKPRFGVRTRITDDRLFLIYLTYEYIKFTNDKSILDEKVSYLIGDKLMPIQEARLEHGQLADLSQNLLGHLKKAIDSVLEFGKHKLLLIGGGDWNDALNQVGMLGKGESVWLSMFAVDILEKYCKLIDSESAKEYKRIVTALKVAIQNVNFDGYYARVYTDDGEWLGTKDSRYMQIDLLCQSWATLSKIGTQDSRLKCLKIAAKKLVDNQYNVIKLLDKPFEKTKYYGYVSSYPRGVRENGGQYTHAAVWYAKACAMAGQSQAAIKLLDMLNPIVRGQNQELYKSYKGEPYVLAADIYTNPDNYARMGWSWYTGSASWLYDTIIKDYLGIEIIAEQMHFKKPILPNWHNIKLSYKYKKCYYNISYGISQNECIKINGISNFGNMVLPLESKEYSIDVTVMFKKDNKQDDNIV